MQSMQPVTGSDFHQWRPDDPWTPEEKEAWAPPGAMTVSEFAEAYRVVSPKISAFPGPWNNSRSPYLCEMMDTPARVNGPKICTYLKPAQVGASECARNIIYYWAHRDPGPCLIVYPDVQTAKSQFVERLKPLFEEDGMLIKFNHNEGLMSVQLDTMDIYVTWASNPARLAARPIRYLILDEVDKMRFPPTAREQSPIQLAIARLRTWGADARAVLISTPSLTDAPIWQYYSVSDVKKDYRVRCVKCEHYFYPSWKKNVKWADRLETADHRESDLDWGRRIAGTQEAWLECPKCEHKHYEPERLAAAANAKWFTEVTSEWDPETVGFRFSVLATAWTPIYQLVKKWLQVHMNPEKLQEFINQDLGEVFEDASSVPTTKRLKEFIIPGSVKGVVPPWVGLLIAGADSQRDGFYWSIRGYGQGLRSRLVDYGFSPDLETLKQAALEREFPIAGSNMRLPVNTLAIDARGSTAGPHMLDGDMEITPKVLAWAQSDPRIRALMGVRRSGATQDPIREVPWQYEYRPPKGASRFLSGKRYSVDVSWFKDLLISHIQQGIWELPEGTTDEFLGHFEAESKVKEVKNGVVRWVWKKLSERKPNHWFDTEVYCLSIAHRLRLETIAPEHELIAARRAHEHAMNAQRRRYNGEEPDKPPWVRGFKT